MSSEKGRQTIWGALAGLMLAGAVALPQAVQAQDVAFASARREVTYAADVEPIMRENCVSCHHPGTSAPMALESYQDVRRWATRIKVAVENRMMPPGWYIDRTVGIQHFKNDPSLPEEDIETIANWVDAGAPAGDLSRIPPAPAWKGEHEYWQLEDEFGWGPPDFIISAPPYMVPAESGDQWYEPETALADVISEQLTGERWIRALETRPGDPMSGYVFHHVNTGLIRASSTGENDGDGGGLTDAAVGKRIDMYPEDSGKRVLPDDRIRFSLHLYSIGEEVEANVQIGVWLYPEGERPRYATEDETSFNSGESRSLGLPRYTDMLVPPHGFQELRGTFVLDQNARVHSVRGHMHLRGGYQMMEAIYPDGRREVISKIDWNHLWHTTHIYEDWAQPLLPKGTVIIATSLLDNTAENPSNPDPDQWVVYGRRSVSEMAHIRFGITYIPDEDFQQMLEERERVLEERARGSQPIASR
jgi:hypothetical protein